MESLQNNMEIEKYNYFEKFHDNLKVLKRTAKRKSRQSFLRKLTKNLSHYQIITLIKFRPKLYLHSDEIYSITDKFENDNLAPFIEPSLITLPDLKALGKEEPIEKNFFLNNNLDFYQHLTIPIHPNCDLNLDATLFTKNEYLFYVFDVYASYNIADVKIKNGISLGNQNGVFVSLEKQINKDQVVGMDINLKKVNFAQKELMSLWIKNSKNLLYLNAGSREAIGWKHFRDFYNCRFFINPELNRVNTIYISSNLKAGLSLKSNILGLKSKVFGYMSEIYSKLSVNFSVKLFDFWRGIISCDIYHNKIFVLNIGFKKKSFKVEVPFFISNLENLMLANEKTKNLAGSILIVSGICILLGSSYYYSRQKKIQETKSKKNLFDKQSKREVEIKLIQKKAAESYLNECKVNGLVILEAYYGSAQIIDELVFVQDKITFLEKNPQKKKRIIDVTIPLRFQVLDSCLNLFGHSKKHLFGFFNPCEGHEKIKLYIRYYSNKLLKEDVFMDKDEVQIRAEKAAS